jgi:integrase
MEHYSPAYVQKQLGHHSITMTVDTYGHWIPGEGKKDLDHVLRGNPRGHGPREKDPKIAYLTKIK